MSNDDFLEDEISYLMDDIERLRALCKDAYTFLNAHYDSQKNMLIGTTDKKNGLYVKALIQSLSEEN